jgi:hypothetical protein
VGGKGVIERKNNTFGGKERGPFKDIANGLKGAKSQRVFHSGSNLQM